MANLTKEEFLDWKDHPFTEAFLLAIEQRLDDSLAELAVGGTLGEYSEQRTAHMVGYIKAYREILRTDFEDVEDVD